MSLPGHSGFGGMTYTVPATGKAIPPAKPTANASFPDWIKQDMEWKEQQAPKQKFS